MPGPRDRKALITQEGPFSTGWRRRDDPTLGRKIWAPRRRELKDSYRNAWQDMRGWACKDGGEHPKKGLCERIRIHHDSRRFKMRRSPSLNSESDKKDLVRMGRDLKRKVDETVDVEDTLTPFSFNLKATLWQRHLKQYNFNLFHGLEDPEEIPNVLWAYRTTMRASTRGNPFKLAYDIEALLPLESGSPLYRVRNFDEVSEPI